jgi:tRNA G18 (ribose-2'-O)-methylase SpoU
MKENFCVILHNIRSAFNVGSIFRTADAANVDKIFLTGYTPTPDKNKEITKTALGAENFVKWEQYKNISYLLEKLKKEKYYLVAIEQAENSIPFYKFKPKFPLVLILGSEVRGLDKRILKKVDKTVEIPMFGKKESLNVAVAFGIIAYCVKINKIGRV